MLDHRAWVGCVPWDLIQPAFMFMVGVSLPYSIASRRAKGQSFRAHAGAQRLARAHPHRARHLSPLAVASQTYFTFEDVLTQIGLGYVFLFLLGVDARRARSSRPPR